MSTIRTTNAIVTQVNSRDIAPERVKAWLNMKGTGTIAINDSHGVSSIADAGTGLINITLANPMASTYYAWSGSAKEDNSGGAAARWLNPSRTADSATVVQVVSCNSSGTAADCIADYFSAIGDLA